MKKRNRLQKYRTSLLRRHPSAYLLAAQLLSLVLYASLADSPSGGVLLSAFGVLVLALVIWVIERSPTTRWIAWVLAAPIFVLSLASTLFDNPALLTWSALLESVLYFYTAGSLIAYMMRDDWVTTDELYAAGATFTLLAWGYAFAYQVCLALVPGSFSSSLDSQAPRAFIELLSLSFTNLTATGLGDLLPVSTPARVLVMLEQFTGIAYVAMVVSRLVGMTLTRRKGRNTS